jgi:hypothetical protein
MNLEVGKHSLAELLASYVDKIFRKGGSKDSKAPLEEIID